MDGTVLPSAAVSLKKCCIQKEVYKCERNQCLRLVTLKQLFPMAVFANKNFSTITFNFK